MDYPAPYIGWYMRHSGPEAYTWKDVTKPLSRESMVREMLIAMKLVDRQGNNPEDVDTLILPQKFSPPVGRIL